LVSVITEGIKSTRFYGVREIQRLERDRANDLNISPDELRRIQAREMQVQAIAVLTAARVGKVKINPYERGILNKLAEGKYTEAVFGKADSSGRRQFEQGTFVNQIGFGKGGGGVKDARAKEKADILREYRWEVSRSNLKSTAKDFF
jgi:hypothetical protein